MTTLKKYLHLFYQFLPDCQISTRTHEIQNYNVCHKQVQKI